MQRFTAWMKSIWEFILYKILRADDPPHKLALGMGIAIFWTFTPTIGLQTVLVLTSAWLLRANKAVGLPVVWISNFATMIPIFYVCYLIGCWPMGLEPLDTSWWTELYSPVTDGESFGLMRFYYGKIYEILTPLCVGSLLVASVLGVLSYIATYYAIIFYRYRVWGALEKPQAKKESNDSDSSAKRELKEPRPVK